MYTGFWGLAALSLILLGHGVFCWIKETKGKELIPIPGKIKLFFAVLGIIVAAAFAAGVVCIVCKTDSTVPYVLGLLMLLVSFSCNGQLRRFIPYFIKKEEQEETNHE